MTGDVLSTYVNRVAEEGNIEFDSQFIIDLIFQGVNTVLLIAILVIIIRLGLLGITALKIYIKKNNQ